MSNFDLSKCKPFDAKAAMEGKPVVNRMGEKRIVISISKPGGYPVVAYNEKGHIFTNTIDGYDQDCKTPSDGDLFMAPETITVWVNLYKYGNGLHALAHYTEKAAINGHSGLNDYLGTISGTIEL